MSPGRLRGLGWLGALAAVIAVVVVLAPSRDEPPERVTDVPVEALHLPTRVNAPGAWSQDTDVRGPYAAVGISVQLSPQGLTREREVTRLFAVSAVDQTSAWLRLPRGGGRRPGVFDGFTISPNGRWMAWPRFARHHHGRHLPWIDSWAVMDTVTRRVSDLRPEDAPRVRATMADLAFSGDSRYLLTSFERPGAPDTRGHEFVAWDVRTGAPTVLEEPGFYWLPNLGSAPSGVVWSRHDEVMRADPATGRRASLRLPYDVVVASWGPDDAAFAYIGRSSTDGRPWRLYAGPSTADLSLRILPAGADEPSQILGWVDARHVVVGNWSATVQVVDVVTGAVQRLDLDGYGDQLNGPILAGDLWANPLADARPPEHTSDPRAPWRWAGAGVLALGLGGLLVVRIRARGRIAAGPSGHLSGMTSTDGYDDQDSEPTMNAPADERPDGVEADGVEPADQAADPDSSEDASDAEDDPRADS